MPKMRQEILANAINEMNSEVGFLLFYAQKAK